MANIRSSLRGNLFRPSQSLAVFTATQLLDKLYWDLDQLEQLRWQEDLGRSWRQAVSYKAMDCAMTIWHVAEWFSQEVIAVYPQEGICHFLDIKDHTPPWPIKPKKLRAAAVKKCPELEICRIIAVASKHYEVGDKPRPDLHTSCDMRLARRGDEQFMRPVMWVEVNDNGQRRELREVFHACYVFWRHVAYVGRPGERRPPGEPLPNIELPVYRPKVGDTVARRTRPNLFQRLRSAFSRSSRARRS